MKKLKFVLPIFHILSIYFPYILYALNYIFKNTFSHTFISIYLNENLLSIYAGLVVISLVLNFISTIYLYFNFKEDTNYFLNTALIMKVLSVIAFILNFGAWFFATLFVAIFTGPLSLLALPLAITFTYIMMLPSSFYGIVAIKNARTKKYINSSAFYIFCQFLFVLDVLSIIVLYINVKNKIKK